MTHFVFSGGEVHTKVTPKVAYDGIVRLTVIDYTMNGFMALAETVEVLRRQGVQEIWVDYPYFPYARQDRVMESDEPFSLKIFADMVNALKLDNVMIVDPHSDVTPALLNNCFVMAQDIVAHAVIPEAYFTNPEVIFVSPDAGAFKKVSKLMPDDNRIAIGTKHRDLKDKGKITHTSVYSPVPLKGKSVIVVDDICDGGRTFLALADALKAQGASRLALYVTHGIFSQGLDALAEKYDNIFTTNSFPQVEHSKLHVKNLFNRTGL